MPRGVEGSSDTPARALHAAKSRAYYAKNKEKIAWRSNAWNRVLADYRGADKAKQKELKRVNEKKI